MTLFKYSISLFLLGITIKKPSYQIVLKTTGKMLGTVFDQNTTWDF